MCSDPYHHPMVRGPKKTPSPTESAVTYNSWTSSVHTTATETPDSVMTNRAVPNYYEQRQIPRTPTIGSRITTWGDFPGVDERTKPSPPPGDGTSIRTRSGVPIQTHSRDSIREHSSDSQPTTRRAGPYEVQHQTTPPTFQQPQAQSQPQADYQPHTLQQPRPRQPTPINTHQPSNPRSSEDSTLIGTPIGEHSFPTEHRSQGRRVEPILQRGVLSRAGPDGQKQWRFLVENIIGYTFQNPDLLEEALETPGSGISCVGASCRNFYDGNGDLAKVGARVMELVVRDQCYIFKVPEGEVILPGCQ